MPRPDPDPALRRMVADLAMLHADDAAAILGELDAGQRQKVETLLREYASVVADAPLDPSPTFDASQLSPWLAQRLNGIADMTDEARQALRACAVRLYPATAGRSAP